MALAILAAILETVFEGGIILSGGMVLLGVLDPYRFERLGLLGLLMLAAIFVLALLAGNIGAAIAAIA